MSVLLLGGCGHTAPQLDSEAPYGASRPPEIGDIQHTRTGHYVSQPQLLTSLAHYPLIYVGEVHDNPASHRLQLEILEAMQARYPGELSLGMEMFERGQQGVLNRWLAGELSEKDFIRESRWFENWGLDFELYRGLLEFSRDQQIPVIALNASSALARKVSQTPLAQLDPETKAQLPEMDMTDPYQRAMIDGIFSGHAAGASMIESFYRRQTLWDETMAESVAGYMRAHPGRRMVVLAGGWHVRYGFGVPRRVHRRLPLPYVLVGGHNLEVPEEKQALLMDVEIPDFPMRPVDYLVYQRYEVFKPRGVRLGVMLENDEDQAGVRVTDVIPDSVAARAGIQKGDLILSFEGVGLKDSFDLVYAARTRLPGGSARIEIGRGGASLVLEANFEDTGHESAHTLK